MRWRNYAVLRRFAAAMLWNEAKQYAIFLLVWQILNSIHKILRITTCSLLFLYALADVQELASRNLLLVQQSVLYSVFAYGVSSLLLFIMSPGSKILQSLQAYFSASKLKNRFARQVLLHYRLWLEMPLVGILYAMEFILAILLVALYFLLIAAAKLAI